MKVHRAEAEARLIQGGWSTFLVKVINESGMRGRLEIESPQSGPVLHRSSNEPEPKEENYLSAGPPWIAAGR